MADITHHSLNHPTVDPSGFARPASGIRHVELDRPWAWLAAGWQDFARAPVVSLTYGLGLVAASFLLIAGLAAMDMTFLVLPMAAGFMLIGPLVAVGLYDTSRRLQRREPVSLGTALLAYRRNFGQIATVGAILMLCLLFWMRCALLLFALFFAANPPPLDEIYTRLFFSLDGLTMVFTGTLIGAVFAFATFAVGAVSIPMLLDRPTNAVTAVLTSIQAVRENWPAMAVWAALITLFTAAGMVTAFLGLAFTLPLIAYASWHAYDDLVGRDRS